MNQREAIYLFVAWLSSRKEIIQIGSGSDCAPWPPLIEAFCDKEGLEECTEKYPHVRRCPVYSGVTRCLGLELHEGNHVFHVGDLLP